MDWSLPVIDDEDLQTFESERQKHKASKQERVAIGRLGTGSQRPILTKKEKRKLQKQGVDISVAEAEVSKRKDIAMNKEDDDLAPLPAEATIEEREDRWGFSEEELKKASKVIERLFLNPGLFEGDSTLQESKLHLLITRPKHIKRQNHQAYRKIVREEQQRWKDEDRCAIQLTGMKKERDEATQRLLQLCTSGVEDTGLSIEGGEVDDTPGPSQPSQYTTAQPKGLQGELPTPPETSSPSSSANPRVTVCSEEGAPDETLNKARMCYCCKAKYRTLHHYYYSMCTPCGNYNFEKRHLKRDLTGKVVLLTGCRIKIGWEMALSLLRCGATLLGTTRFAYDAVSRFAAEPDYEDWKHRLHLFSLDLRDLWMVEQFCSFVLREFPKIFAIVNNAAQTIQRTSSYTQRLREQETNPTDFQLKAIRSSDHGSEWRSFFTGNSSITVGQPLQLEHHPKENSSGSAYNTKTQQASQSPEADRELNETEKVALAAHRALLGHDAELKKQKDHLGRETVTLASKGNCNGSDQEEKKKERPPADLLYDDEFTSASNEEISKTKHPLVYDRYDTLFEASDLRTTNSWTKKAHEVEGGEATETMTINALAPFIINSRLRSALANRTTPQERGEVEVEQMNSETGEKEVVLKSFPDKREKRFIINVSAMEGQFCRFKLTTHPHTNMAKAALNMMTRTSGADYAEKDGIYMNAVDTGWITDETPLAKRASRTEKDLLCPIDEVDAAARCLDLIYVDSCEHSQFWKDYHPILW